MTTGTTATQYAILDRLLANLARGATVDAGGSMRRSARDYVDPERLAREKATLFTDFPLVAGFSRDLDAPGAFKTFNVAGVELLLIRGKDGIARAFRNMCRHRGVKLTSEAAGRQSLFTCPFHAWTYNAAGQLVGTPKADCFGEVPADCRSLARFPLVEKYGILWVKLSPGEPDVDAWLGDLTPEIAALGLGERERLAGNVIDAKINWKLAIDTFGETYHFDALHRNTIRHYYQSNIQDYETFGRHHRMVFAGNSIEDLNDQARAEWSYPAVTLTAYFLFPNTQIITVPNHVDLFQIIPDAVDPGRSRTLYSYYPTPDFVTPEGGLTHEATYQLTAFVIEKEDYATAETAQLNFAASPDSEVVFGRNEPALHHYRRSQELIAEP